MELTRSAITKNRVTFVALFVVALAGQYHIPAVRLPWQGLRTLTWKNFVMAAVMLPWVIRLRHKLQQAGIAHNREIFGLYETCFKFPIT